jgi:hypothetical protein
MYVSEPLRQSSEPANTAPPGYSIEAVRRPKARELHDAVLFCQEFRNLQQSQHSERRPLAPELGDLGRKLYSFAMERQGFP